VSEHGYANAIDIHGLLVGRAASLSLTDTALDREFRVRLRDGACAHFTTVLGPGADAHHENHIHLDLADRRGDYRLCQWDVREMATATPVPMPPARPAHLSPGLTRSGRDGRTPQTATAPTARRR
jgi:hypothetical protein